MITAISNVLVGHWDGKVKGDNEEITADYILIFD